MVKILIVGGALTYVKAWSSFTKEEKLAIVKEGEKTDGKAVCAKYGFSDQAYRVWRYKAGGIQPFGGTFSFRLRDSRLRTLLRPTAELADLARNVRKHDVCGSNLFRLSSETL